MGDLFTSLKVSGSGLSVFRKKMNTAAENMANAETTKTANGQPYKKKIVKISANDVPTSFSRDLKSASIQLQQTNQGHLPAKPIARSQDTKVFEAEGREVADRTQAPRMVYDPSHPDADEEGFVAMPDIDPLEEMVDMMTAARAYEANITAVQTVKEMFKKAMDI